MAILNPVILKSMDSWAGTNKVLSSENSNLRKHPRTEQAAFEQGPRPKTQRSSGAFGEACLVRN